MLTSGWSPCCFEDTLMHLSLPLISLPLLTFKFEKALALVYKILKALSIRATRKNGLNLPDRLEIR